MMSGEPVRECDCGASDLVVHLMFTETLRLIDDASMKAVDPTVTGKKKRITDLKVGTEVFKATGELQERYRKIDYRADQYDEVICRTDTGEVIREVHEKLSDHQGRGSARRDRGDGDTRPSGDQARLAPRW